MRIFRRNNKVFLSLSDLKNELIEISNVPAKKFLGLSKKPYENWGLQETKIYNPQRP